MNKIWVITLFSCCFAFINVNPSRWRHLENSSPLISKKQIKNFFAQFCTKAREVLNFCFDNHFNRLPYFFQHFKGELSL